MSNQPIGVGVVGLGKWAEVIGPGIRDAEGIEIAACYTRTPENREDFARRYASRQGPKTGIAPPLFFSKSCL